MNKASKQALDLEQLANFLYQLNLNIEMKNET